MKKYLECLRALNAVQSSDMRYEAINTTVSCAEDAMKNNTLLEQARFLHQVLGAAPMVMQVAAYSNWILRPNMKCYLLGIAKDKETIDWVKGNPSTEMT